MAGFKAPDFQDRAAASRAAKESALEKLRNKAPIDPEELERQREVAAAREAAAAEKRAARQQKLAEEKAERQAKKEAAAAAAAKAAAPKMQKTAEELKAIRDARYAARKARKK